MAAKRRLRERRAAYAAAILLLCSVAAMSPAQSWEAEAYVAPDAPEIDLAPMLETAEDRSEGFSQTEYRVLLDQTGLSKRAVDELMNQGDKGIARILDCQARRYAPMDVECRKSGTFTWGERLNLSQSANEAKTPESGWAVFLPDLKDGDILISRNAHTLGWRHGHAALVIDAKRGRTLECVYWGEPSCVRKVSKWENYPSFGLFRLKDAERKINPEGLRDQASVRLGDAVADYAKAHMEGVNYGLLAGIPTKAPKELKKSQCAHLVWYSFQQFGYDLDSDGGWLVTPKDLANSDQLELVQIFGAKPDHFWD